MSVIVIITPNAGIGPLDLDLKSVVSQFGATTPLGPCHANCEPTKKPKLLADSSAPGGYTISFEETAGPAVVQFESEEQASAWLIQIADQLDDRTVWLIGPVCE